MQTAKIIPFHFEAHQVRTVLIDDQPWFVAADVCQALAIRNNRDAIARLDDDERGVATTDTPSGQQDMGVINESGLYSLILTSRKAEAKRFKKWVTAEVLPAIRKHGRYEDNEGKMNTLIGQTIGTDGFHMLGAVVKGKVSGLPATAQRRATMKIWSQTHAAFGVRSAADIPADQLDAARNFIAAYVVLEGEYIEARKTEGLSFSAYEAYHIYLLMSRFSTMHQHKESMLSAARALGSSPLMDFFDQLNEGQTSFAALDKRRDELYGAYCSFGLNGGYALTA